MLTKQAKQQYDLLIESGELLSMFPSMSGKWRDDKKEFLRFCELNETALNFDVVIDEDFDEMAEGDYGFS